MTSRVEFSVAPDRWLEIGKFLARDLILLEPSRRSELRREWESVRAAEESIDDRLVVGIVGGTGVGKSTLINALAGAEISRSSDRRPTTDRVICYRHERTPMPPGFPIDDIAEPQPVHRSDSLERVILLDFPDFDSVESLHHEVLERFFPRLDVLVILVDDVKYADARLFALIDRLPQSHENLHIVLNKVDALERRYPGRWREVAGEIIDDLRGKLAAHVGLEIDRERFVALAALPAWRERDPRLAADGDATGASPVSGDFDRFVGELEAYRAERRRRAAKDLNIDARQRALVAALAAASPSEAGVRAVAEARSGFEERRRELERLRAGITANLLSVDERHRLARERLGRNASSFGFPVDLFIGAIARLPWRGRRRGQVPSWSAERLEGQFGPFASAADNAVRELGVAVESHVPVGRDLALSNGLFARAAEGLERFLDEWRERFAERRRWRNHVPGAIVIVGAALTLFHPAIDAAAHSWAEDGSVAWGEFGKELVLALVGLLSPTFLVGTLFALVFAYACGALYAWTREAHKVEAVVRRGETFAGETIREGVEPELDRAAAGVRTWLEEAEERSRLTRGDPQLAAR